MYDMLFLVKNFESIDFTVNGFSIYHVDNTGDTPLGATAIVDDTGSAVTFYVGFDDTKEQELHQVKNFSPHHINRLEIVDSTGIVYSTWDAVDTKISLNFSRSTLLPVVSVDFHTERTSVMSRQDVIAELYASDDEKDGVTQMSDMISTTKAHHVIN